MSYEFGRAQRLLATAVVGAGLANYAIGCGGGEGNAATEGSLPPACRSETATHSYPADPDATPDRKSWQKGVRLTTTHFPEGILGLEVSYRGPNDPDWRDTSQPVLPSRSELIGMKIGNHRGVLGVQYVAGANSPACGKIADIKPNTRFGRLESFKGIKADGAALPDFRGPRRP